MVEAIGPKHRSDFVLLTGFGWIIGHCALPWIALCFHNFRHMTLASAICVILMGLWFYFYIDESARWQLVHNKFEITEKILCKNRKFMKDQYLKEKMAQLKQHFQLVIKSNQI